jgi:membrane protease YdiL (CAAX protease family)
LGRCARAGAELGADFHLGPANAGDHGLFNHVPEEIGWTGFVFACLQDRQGPLRTALLTAVFFWLYHVPGLYLETGSSLATAAVLISCCCLI